MGLPSRSAFFDRSLPAWGWKCRDILARIDTADDFYFNEVSQDKMEAWSKGRTTLVGDACDCPSLLSVQGSTLATVGAYILASELKRANGDYKEAYPEYQNQFKPFMASKHKIAQTFANSFLPKNWWASG